MKTFVKFVALFVMASGLSACNTWHGFGKDVEKVGDSIQRSGSK
ncbi:MAG: entericidin A/B family lipoprotein [Moraxellaceae bacterium]|nr:entericidin A/B family lipoprotein [Moraxellaceae bacterium]